MSPGLQAPDPSETGTGAAPPGSADHEDVPGMLGDVACGGETAETEADVAGYHQRNDPDDNPPNRPFIQPPTYL